MCSDHDPTVSTKSISAAIRAATQSYDVSHAEIEGAIETMFDLSAGRARDLGPVLTTALLELTDNEPECAFVEPTTSRRAAQLEDPRVDAVVTTRRMTRIIDQPGRDSRNSRSEVHGRRADDESVGRLA